MIRPWTQFKGSWIDFDSGLILEPDMRVFFFVAEYCIIIMTLSYHIHFFEYVKLTQCKTNKMSPNEFVSV